MGNFGVPPRKLCGRPKLIAGFGLCQPSYPLLVGTHQEGDQTAEADCLVSIALQDKREFEHESCSLAVIITKLTLMTFEMDPSKRTKRVQKKLVCMHTERFNMCGCLEAKASGLG